VELPKGAVLLVNAMFHLLMRTTEKQGINYHSPAGIWLPVRRPKQELARMKSSGPAIAAFLEARLHAFHDPLVVRRREM